MRTTIVTCLAAVLVSLSAPQAAAQAPAPAEAQDDGGRIGAGLVIDQIDAERLRQIRGERTRQLALGAGLIAAGGFVGFTHNEWPVDEGVVGLAIAVIGIAALIEPLTWRDLEVRTSANGLALAW